MKVFPAFAITLAAVLPAQAASVEELRALVAKGEYEEASTGALALLATLDGAGKGDSIEAADAIDALVESRWRSGEAGEGDTRKLGERALAIKTRLLGPDAVGTATTLHHLGVVDFFLGDYEHARKEWEQALRIREAALGPDHLDVAETANALANLFQTTGQFEAARPLYERAASIREKALGKDNLKVGQTLNNLAALNTILGDYAAALPLAERSLEIKEKALGPDHPQVGTSLTNLGDIYDQSGDRERARPLFERAAGIFEKASGPDNTNVGVALNNLAEQYRRDGRLGEARPLYQRVIVIWEKAHGPDHPRVALALSNYSLLLEAAGELPEAKAMEQRAVDIREKALGPEHPELAESLAHLGAVLAAMGDYDGARKSYERATSIFKHSLGPGHPSLARAELGLSRVEAYHGSAPRAFELSLDAERIARDHLRLTGRGFAEEHALRYAADRPFGLDLALSLAVERKGAAPARPVFDSLVRSRAVVLDEMGARHRSIAGSGDPEVARLAETLAGLRTRLANMTVRGVGDLKPETYRALLERTQQEKERAERALGTASAEFAEEQQRSRVGLEDVTASLPAKSALVAFVVYRHQSPPPASRSKDTAAAPLPKPVPTIAALVLAPGKTAPEVVRLGTVEAIDPLVARWKREASASAHAESAYREAATALRHSVWDPLATALRDAERVFVVPDGSLNLVAFASLPIGKNGYLIESGPTLHYLSAERDLVARAGAARSGTGLLALGGPEYDSRAPAAPSPTAAGTRSSGCATFESLRFDPLPGAEREAREIVAAWSASAAGADPAPVYLHAAAASEAALKAAAPGKRVLHLATHGFFLGGDCATGGDSTRGLKIVGEKDAAPRIASRYVNPLLLSGLALAGANQRAQAAAGEEDGVLTAEEIAALDLSGVDWAVLSACDTGVGEIRAGEGVFGLRRAMQVAGVHTLVMSLWPVDDEATRAWMTELYRARLSERLDTAAAVRQAGLRGIAARRAAGRSTHPFYWAAFVAAGDWR